MEVKFELKGNVKLSDLSIGESGVWAIDLDGRARFFDKTTKDWMVIPKDDRVWKSIESASPYGTVFAIDSATNELYFRDGIAQGNSLGNEWVGTGVNILQVSSGPYITYAVLDDGQLRSFSMPPSKLNLKTWISSWKITDKNIENKLSVGFDGSLVYLNSDNYLVQRNPLTLNHEEDDSKWIWQMNNIPLTDVSAGPFIIGISADDLVIKPGNTIRSLSKEQKAQLNLLLQSTPIDVATRPKLRHATSAIPYDHSTLRFLSDPSM